MAETPAKKPPKEKKVKEKKEPLVISFADIANQLEPILETMDPDHVGEDMKQIFPEATELLKDSIDRRIKALTYFKGAIPATKEMRDSWAARARKMERSESWLKENTRIIMNLNPSVPYQGSIGSLRLQNNSQAALKVICDQKDVTVHNAVEMQTVKFFGIPDKYLKHINLTVIDQDVVRADLEAGVDLSTWVTLERGNHVRIGS